MKLLKKILISLLGLILLGIGVGLIIDAKFGTDAVAAFVTMISTIINIKYGTAYLIVNIVLFIMQLIMDRKTIFVTTILNIFTVGYVADFTRFIISLISSNYGLVIRILFLIFGLIICNVGIAFVIEADAGLDPYDSIPVILSEKYSLGKYKYLKILEDSIFGMLAVILYLIHYKSFDGFFSFLGIGTIAAIIFSGPIVDFSRRIIRDKIFKFLKIEI